MGIRSRLQRTWLACSARSVTIAAILVSLCGCSAILDYLSSKIVVSKDSGRSPTRIVGLGTFEFDYSNHFYFDRELTISIDSLFARLSTEDRAAWNALQDFLRPAEDLLTIYGIDLTSANLVPDHENTRFVVRTDYSEWRSLRNSRSPLLEAPLRKNSSHGFRCRAKIVDAEIAFNSLSPNRLFIQANMLVEMQDYSARKKTWQYVELNSDSVDAVVRRLTRQLVQDYNDYINKRYGIRVIPPPGIDHGSDLD